MHVRSDRRYGDSGSQKVQHYLDVISYKIKAVAPLAMRTSKYSPDSERAPGARSIAVEFLEVRMAIQKLQRCENATFHFHAAPFGTRSLPQAASGSSVSVERWVVRTALVAISSS